MRTKMIFIALSFAVAAAGVAQGATAASASSVTARAAKKARVLLFSGGGSKDIFDVHAGPNDNLAAVEVVENSRGVNIPGSTISAGDKRWELKTSLALKDLPSNE